MSNLPFKRSYWVIPGKIIAGCYPGGQTQASASIKTRGLINAGVTNILSLMETSERIMTDSPSTIICRTLRNVPLRWAGP